MTDKAMQTIVVTDLDGTLLDHHNYRWDAAREAMDLLSVKGIPLVMCSSKTAAEMQHLREQLALEHPFITENGGAVYLRDDSASPGQWQGQVLGMNRAEIIRKLAQAREAGFKFRGFNDMNVSEVMELTGLDEDSASKALQREFTEPLLWEEDASRQQEFMEALQAQGLDVVAGGRFLHVSAGCDKGAAVQWLKHYYEEKLGIKSRVIALGDSANDVSMLEAADIAVAVKSPVKDFPELKNENVIYTNAFGPAGWNEAIMTILNEEKV